MMENKPTNKIRECRGGCGFFGSPERHGFCSKCFQNQPQFKKPTSTPVKTVEKEKEHEEAESDEEDDEEEGVDGVVLILHKLTK